MIIKTPFSKMNGLGNKIIVADMRHSSENITPEAVITLAKNAETAFDQIMAVHTSVNNNADYRLEIWNADGSLAKACGNGTRCVVEWLNTKGLGECFTFETESGNINAQISDQNMVCVDMGEPHLDWKSIPVSREIPDTNYVEFNLGPLKQASLVSMGNPHAVFFVDEDIWKIPLEQYGSQLEHDKLFPQRCNITIARIIAPQRLEMRTWERGAGLTLACGTAACATTVAANRRRLAERHITTHVPGGDLYITWDSNNHVLMAGSTEFEFSGSFNPLNGYYQRDSE